MDARKNVSMNFKVLDSIAMPKLYCAAFLACKSFNKKSFLQEHCYVVDYCYELFGSNYQFTNLVYYILNIKKYFTAI